MRQRQVPCTRRVFRGHTGVSLTSVSYELVRPTLKVPVLPVREGIRAPDYRECDLQNIIYHTIGIGFGPSNMALAIAVEETIGQSGEETFPIHFFEKKECFGWHRGMLIEGTTMQVSFLKDLATIRNPTSTYGFLSYLNEKGRLVDFVNHKAIFPSRTEFHDYLEWAAARLKRHVSYASEVLEVLPVYQGDNIEYLDVVVQQSGASSARKVFRTRNIVLASGLEPKFPADVIASERVWHSSDTLHRIRHLSEAPRAISVVGAGQSAAEVTAFLYDHFRDTEVRAIFGRYGYSSSDDTPFINKVFDPAAVDDYFHAPQDVKTTFMEQNKNTNYSVVDADLLNVLYRLWYQERVKNQQRLQFMNMTRVVATHTTAASVELSVEHILTGESRQISSDIVIFATGYRPGNPMRFLGALASFFSYDKARQLNVDRDYRVSTAGNLKCGIYLQGSTEHSHGISSSLLSNISVRAGEILESLLAGEPDRSCAIHAARDEDEHDVPLFQ